MKKIYYLCGLIFLSLTLFAASTRIIETNKLYLQDQVSGFKIIMQPPLLGADYTFQFPNSVGSANQSLITNGTFSSWSTVPDAGLTSSYLYADGTRQLSNHWNAGVFNITSATFIGNLIGNAATSTQFLATPTSCGANTFASSIASNGNLTCSTVPDAALASSYLFANGGRGLSADWNAGAFTITAATFTGALNGTAATVTTNANLTGPVTSVGNATAIANGALSTAKTTGTPTQVMYIDATTFMGGDPAFTFADTTKTLSVFNVSTGTLNLNGSASGTLTILPAAATTSHTLTMPAIQGGASTILQNNGSGVLSWVSGSGIIPSPLPIANGGTNNVTPYTLGSVIISNGTFLTEDNSNLFWDNTNKILSVGWNNNAKVNNGNFWPSIQAHGNNNVDRTSIGVFNWANGSGAPRFAMAKTNSGVIGTVSSTSDGNVLGEILFDGSISGTNFFDAASISTEQDGSLAAGHVPGRLIFKTSTNTVTLNERMRITGAGNVGIGTTTPNFLLDVNGVFRTNNGVVSQGAFSGTPPTDGMVMDYSTGFGRFSTFASDGFQWFNGGVGTTPLFTITSSPNFGMNTTTPNKSGSSNALTVNTSTATNFAAIELSSADIIRWYTSASSTGVFDVTSGTIPKMFYVNGAERMRIDASGNVGIGVTPVQKLHVGAPNTAGVTTERIVGGNGGTGEGSVLEILASNNSPVISIGNSSALLGGTYNEDTVYYSGSTNNQRFYTGGSERMRISGTGQVVHSISLMTLGNGNNNNVSLPGSSWATIVGPTAAFTITGIAAAQNGSILTIYNPTGSNMTISNLDANSTSANQFYSPSGGSITTTGVGVVQLMYLTSENKWLIVNSNL